VGRMGTWPCANPAHTGNTLALFKGWWCRSCRRKLEAAASKPKAPKRLRGGQMDATRWQDNRREEV
jgi:hypothetical protein